VDWLDRLDRDEGWNPIIDELAWHVREGRWPIALVASRSPGGVEFRFSDLPPAFHSIDADALPEHWREAVRAIEAIPALGTLELIC
jgi:hypothetical protein